MEVTVEQSEQVLLLPLVRPVHTRSTPQHLHLTAPSHPHSTTMHRSSISVVSMADLQELYQAIWRSGSSPASSLASR